MLITVDNGSRGQENHAPLFLYLDQEKKAIEKISFSWLLSLPQDPLLFENKCFNNINWLLSFLIKISRLPLRYLTTNNTTKSNITYKKFVTGFNVNANSMSREIQKCGSVVKVIHK